MADPPLRLIVTIVLMVLFAAGAVIVVFSGRLADQAGRPWGSATQPSPPGRTPNGRCWCCWVTAMIALLYRSAPNIRVRGFRWLTQLNDCRLAVAGPYRGDPGPIRDKSVKFSRSVGTGISGDVGRIVPAVDSVFTEPSRRRVPIHRPVSVPAHPADAWPAPTPDHGVRAAATPAGPERDTARGMAVFPATPV